MSVHCKGEECYIVIGAHPLREDEILHFFFYYFFIALFELPNLYLSDPYIYIYGA